MIKKAWENGEGFTYLPEKDEVYICAFDTPKINKPRAVIAGKGTDKERAVTIIDRYIGVKIEGSDEVIPLKITESQSNRLTENTPLTNKRIKFREYNHPKYDKKLLAVDVLDSGKDVQSESKA